jgi:hypothetical protein
MLRFFVALSVVALPLTGCSRGQADRPADQPAGPSTPLPAMSSQRPVAPALAASGHPRLWLTAGDLGWNSIDHQMADGNHFELYRNGEWLTKGRAGYANIAEGIASSEFYNTVTIGNDRPVDRDDSD